jgi:tetratricopeptide (TPR) repeat protein
LQKVYYGFLHIGFKKIYALQKDRARKEEWVKKYLALKPIDDWGYAELGRICKDEKRFAEAGQMFKKALEFDPDNELTYVRLAWVYRAQGRFAEARQMLKKALELNPSLYMDFVPGALATLYWEEGRFDLARQCWQKASRLRKDYYNPVTVNNYHRLKEIIERRGIRLVCVQYPMRSLEPLKQIFAGEEGVIFVDNEEVFKDAIRKDGFDVYFVDMFAGDFGHCTPKGNRLLAENIARTILKEVFDVEEKQVSPISVIRNR